MIDTAIERVTYTNSQDFWACWGASRSPVILENSVVNWRAESVWSFDYLTKLVGHRITSLDTGYFQTTQTKQHLLSDIFEAIESGTAIAGHTNPYLRNIDIYKELPELIEDISPRLTLVATNWMSCRFLPRFVPDGLVELFIGGAGSAFPKLHFDTHGTHAFITQLKGTKHIVLAPPSATDALHEAFGNPEKFSLTSDPEKLAACHISQAVLSAGDTLFVPAGWWHTTYMTELSVSVSANCVNQTNWREYVLAITKHGSLLKRKLKRAVLVVLGAVLQVGDMFGFKFLYRPKDN